MIKYICIKDWDYKRHDILRGERLISGEICYMKLEHENNNGYTLYKQIDYYFYPVDGFMEINKNHFITIAEWRDKQINEILNDEIIS